MPFFVYSVYFVFSVRSFEYVHGVHVFVRY